MAIAAEGVCRAGLLGDRRLEESNIAPEDGLDFSD